jgi:hypothetical protein
VLLLLGVTIAIAVWSAWLVRARPVPRWTRWIGRGVIVSTGLSAATTFWLLGRAYIASSDEDTANRATAVSENISIAMNAVAVALTIAILAVLVLTVLTVRAWRPRMR